MRYVALNKLAMKTAAGIACIASVALFAAVPCCAQASFSGGSVAIPGTGTVGVGNPYPSQINVSGLTGTLTGITVTLTGYTHSFTDDVGALLVGPQGQRTLLFDGAGSGSASGLTLVFDDAATDSLPDRGTFSSGTYRPGQNQYGDVFAAPAPQGPYATDFTAFRGADPNGTYSLYIQDFTQDDTGTLSGWNITLSGVSAAPEPNAAALLCVGLVALTPCYRRKIYGNLRHRGR